MAYKPYKMKGHALPGIKQREGHPKVAAEGLAASSPFQDRITNTSGMDKSQSAAATAHNDAHASGKDPHGSTKKSSPAKCPFLAALPVITQVAGAVGAVGGAAKALKKDKE